MKISRSITDNAHTEQRRDATACTPAPTPRRVCISSVHSMNMVCIKSHNRQYINRGRQLSVRPPAASVRRPRKRAIACVTTASEIQNECSTAYTAIQESRAAARKPRDAASVLFPWSSPTTFTTSIRLAKLRKRPRFRAPNMLAQNAI